MEIRSTLTFECRPCGRRFEAAGELEEWTSTIYGPCREYRATCPSCGKRVKEYRPKTSTRRDSGQSVCGEGACGEGPCGSGACEME